MFVKQYLNLGLVILKTLYKNITNLTMKTIHGGAYVTRLARYFRINLEECKCTTIRSTQLFTRDNLTKMQFLEVTNNKKTIKGIIP
ncbi:unnamed protein product [Linum trigynum]|uniref:Uncharacterized protein n=1 Tax=Linum trigynum TaxID=586398 RepID=A0AAV2FCC7_9ROSI